MKLRKLFKINYDHIPKRFSFNDGKKHVFHNIRNRLGDEIFTTALIKYLKQEHGYFFHYYQNCYAIKASNYFPEDLVSFESKNFIFHGLDSFDPGCLWLWNQYLREKKYYCELKEKYDSEQADLDVVFIPLIQPEYNPTRELNSICAVQIFEKLLEVFPKTIMLVDYDKRNIFKYSHPNFFYSVDLKSTFDLIRRSKFFVGCDTGVSHFAAGIQHPRMISIYPDYKLLGVDSKENYIKMKHYIKNYFKIENIFDYNYCALPCCDPKNCRVLLLDKNWVDPTNVIKNIKELENDFLS